MRWKTLAQGWPRQPNMARGKQRGKTKVDQSWSFGGSNYYVVVRSSGEMDLWTKLGETANVNNNTRNSRRRL